MTFVIPSRTERPSPEPKRRAIAPACHAVSSGQPAIAARERARSEPPARNRVAQSMLRLLALVLLPISALVSPAAGQTVSSGYPVGNGAVSLPILLSAPLIGAPGAASTATAPSAAAGGGGPASGTSSGGVSRTGAGSGGPGAASGGAAAASGRSGGGSNWVLCPPPDAAGLEPLLTGTALSCAP
jgi:hypothetical protein